MTLLIKPRIGFTCDCNFCKKSVNGFAELFSLYEKPFSCGCECGKSDIFIYAADGKLCIDYPCSLCGERHGEEADVSYVLDGIIELVCPKLSLPACYIGQAELIEYMDSEDAENELTELILSLITPDR